MATLTAPAPRKPELEKYELAEEIGHGGMATVYRAHDRRLDRDVAVKVIHRHLRENKEVAARFVSEARAVAKVKHPNVVEVYDVSDEGDEERYLVVELIRGTTLRKLLNEHGCMPPEVAAALALELAAGLGHAHEQGVVHRDVKPENVLIAPPAPISVRQSSERGADARAPIVKITDFGIAKLLDAQGVTSTGQVLGSPAHMSPEQIEGGDVTPRSDVFRLGVLMYECNVGKLPFDGKNPAQVLRRVLDGAFTPPERARPTVGAELGRIVSRALAHDASNRWETCEELAQALRAELTRVGFDDPRRELGEYLAEPERYSHDYERRVVERLVELGRRERREGNIALAASAFNRALAFRPDDAELLAEVTSIARRERLRKNTIRIGGIAAVSLTLGGAAYGITRAVRRPAPDTASIIDAMPQATVRTVEIRSEPKTQPVPEGSRLAAMPKPIRQQVAVQAVSAVPKTGTRPVSVVISGASGGTVRIDGQPYRFGTTQELSVGPHQLELVPPNEECCIAPPIETITVPPGDGVLTLRKKISFKPATLVLAVPASAEVMCGPVGGPWTGPGQQIVQMSEAILKAPCKVIHEGAVKAVDVTLRPGKSSTISWP